MSGADIGFVSQTQRHRVIVSSKYNALEVNVNSGLVKTHKYRVTATLFHDNGYFQGDNTEECTMYVAISAIKENAKVADVSTLYGEVTNTTAVATAVPFDEYVGITDEGVTVPFTAGTLVNNANVTKIPLTGAAVGNKYKMIKCVFTATFTTSFKIDPKSVRFVGSVNFVAANDTTTPTGLLPYENDDSVSVIGSTFGTGESSTVLTAQLGQLSRAGTGVVMLDAIIRASNTSPFAFLPETQFLYFDTVGTALKALVRPQKFVKFFAYQTNATTYGVLMTDTSGNVGRIAYFMAGNGTTTDIDELDDIRESEYVKDLLVLQGQSAPNASTILSLPTTTTNPTQSISSDGFIVTNTSPLTTSVELALNLFSDITKAQVSLIPTTFSLPTPAPTESEYVSIEPTYPVRAWVGDSSPLPTTVPSIYNTPQLVTGNPPTVDLSTVPIDNNNVTTPRIIFVPTDAGDNIIASTANGFELTKMSPNQWPALFTIPPVTTIVSNDRFASAKYSIRGYLLSVNGAPTAPGGYIYKLDSAATTKVVKISIEWTCFTPMFQEIRMSLLLGSGNDNNSFFIGSVAGEDDVFFA